MKIVVDSFFPWPVEKVFPLYSNSREAYALFPDILEIRFVEGSFADYRRGAKFSMVQALGTTRVEIQAEVTAYASNQLVAHRLESKIARLSSLTVFHPSAEGTLAHTEMRLRYRPLWRDLLAHCSPLYAQKIKRQQKERFERMQALAGPGLESKVRLSVLGIPAGLWSPFHFLYLLSLLLVGAALGAFFSI